MTSGDSPEKRWNPVYGLAITEDIWEAEAKDYKRKKQLELDQQKLEAQRRASVTGNQDTNTKFNKTRIIKVPDKDITYRQYYSYDDIFFDEE